MLPREARAKTVSALSLSLKEEKSEGKVLKQFFCSFFSLFFAFFSLFFAFCFFASKAERYTENFSSLLTLVFCVKRNINILTKGERERERGKESARERAQNFLLLFFCILNFGRNPPTARAFVLSLLLLLSAERKMLKR